MAARKEIPRELSIYINDKQVINSLAGVTREITRTNSEMRNLNKNSATYDQDLKKLQGTLSQLKDRQSDFKEEIQQTSVVAGEAREKISQIFLGLASGNLNLVKEGLSGIRGSIVGMTKAGLAFIATPIGAAIAVLSGIAISAKAIFDFNKGLQESNKLLTALGISSADLSKVRSEIEAVAKTFKKEFSEVAERANSLAKTYGISISEANAIIAEGLANGGAKNKEFLDSLGEYDEFFAKAGFSAKEFTNVLNEGFDLGIYADKLPDALKEADLSLKEQTKASRDALVNAFGASFSDDILSKVRTGELTTKQALEAIAAKSKETQLSQQQQAQLTADVFKGAGEDAGGALKILEAVGGAAKRELSETAKASLDLVAANERLNKVQSDLFEIENFSDVWTKIQIASTEALSSILEWFADLKKDIQPLIDIVGASFTAAWYNLKAAVSVVFYSIGGILKVFSNAVETVFNFVKKIFKGDFSGALDVLNNGFLKFSNIVSETFGKVKNSILNGLQGILGAVKPFLEALGLDVDFIQKKLESFKSKQVEIKVKTTTDGKAPENNVVENQVELDRIAKANADAREKEADARRKAAEQKKKQEEKAAKEKLDREVALAKALADLAKAELNYFIANNRSKLESGQKLTQDLVNQEIQRLADIKFKKENELAEERLRQIAKAESEGKSAEEIAALKQAIDLNYLVNQQALILEFQSVTDAIKKQYKQQVAAEDLAQLQIDFEVKQELLDSQAEVEAFKRDAKYQEDKDKYYKYLQDGYITKKQFDDLVATLDKKKREDDRIAEIVSVQGKLNELSKLAAATTAIFGQNKASASATAVINGGLAITEILKTPSVFPEPFASISRGVQIAGSIATTLNALKQINSAKAPTTAKFFYGGYTGNSSALGNDEYGAVTGVVHSNEYVVPAVMAQSPKYAATLSWLENERKGIIGNKYFNGGPVTTTASPITNPAASNDEMQQVMRAILFRLENPIAPKLAIGYQEAENIDNLNTDRKNSVSNGTLNQ